MKPLKKISDYEVTNNIYVREGYGCYLCSGPDDKSCVIKAFDLSIIDDASAELKAARILSGINHPNLIRILEVKKDAKLKVYYYRMEHWGDDLRNTIRVKPDPKIAIEIIKQVLEGLAELHKHKLRHRDIKPENIFIKEGQVKIGDYGLVKSQRYITQLTTIAGTRDYMAPEIASGNYDRTVDIYSTGIVLRELLTWESPPFGKLDSRFRGNDNIPETLWPVITKATAQDPAERFQSAEEFISALSHRRDAENAEKKGDGSGSGDGSGYGSGSASGAGNEDGSGDGSGSDVVELDDKLSDLSVSAVKQPIFQKLEISRYPPKPTLYGEQDKPGQFIQVLQAQFDTLAKGTDYEAMLKVARPLANEVERRFGKDNSRTADAYDRVAWVFLKMANYRESGNWYLESSKIDLKLYNEHSREYLNSLYHLAEARLAAEDPPSAEDYYSRMLGIMEKLPVKGHPEDAVIRNNMGAIKHLTKSYTNALTQYQQALTINEKHSKADAMAINLYNMGLAYEAMGNQPSAEPLFKRAAYFANNAFKPGDPALAQILAKSGQA